MTPARRHAPISPQGTAGSRGTLKNSALVSAIGPGVKAAPLFEAYLNSRLPPLKH